MGLIKHRDLPKYLFTGKSYGRAPPEFFEVPNKIRKELGLETLTERTYYCRGAGVDVVTFVPVGKLGEKKQVGRNAFRQSHREIERLLDQGYLHRMGNIGSPIVALKRMGTQRLVLPDLNRQISHDNNKYLVIHPTWVMPDEAEDTREALFSGVYAWERIPAGLNEDKRLVDARKSRRGHTFGAIQERLDEVEKYIERQGYRVLNIQRTGLSAENLSRAGHIDMIVVSSKRTSDLPQLVRGIHEEVLEVEPLRGDRLEAEIHYVNGKISSWTTSGKQNPDSPVVLPITLSLQEGGVVDRLRAVAKQYF